MCACPPACELMQRADARASRSLLVCGGGESAQNAQVDQGRRITRKFNLKMSVQHSKSDTLTKCARVRLRVRAIGVNGRPGKRSDVCYAWWVGATCAVLGRLDIIDKHALVASVLAHQIDKGALCAKHSACLPSSHTTLTRTLTPCACALCRVGTL